MVCNCSMAGTAACIGCPSKQWIDEGRFPSRVFFAYGVDAVEVVRCKGCRWWNTEGYGPEFDSDKFGWCDHNQFDTAEDWYCADGERREEEDGERLDATE